MQSFTLNLAGQHWELHFSKEELETIHLPLLREIVKKAAAKNGCYILFLAGPPGSGKTALGALWEELTRRHNLSKPIQMLPMDGFHFPNAVLDVNTTLRDAKTVSLRKIKGAPETYDLKNFSHLLQDLYTGQEVVWPQYDRQIHDPVPHAIPVMTDRIIFVEGNYLLLDEPGWRDLKSLTDFTIFIECPEALARERVVARLQRGGRTPENAVQHYEFSDLANWRRVMNHRLGCDVVLRVEDSTSLKRIQ